MMLLSENQIFNNKYGYIEYRYIWPISKKQCEKNIKLVGLLSFYFVLVE